MTENISPKLNSIRNSLNAYTGMDFHNRISTVMSYAYRYLGKKYIKTKQQGGDGGADGVVPQDNLYFAFTADTLSTFANVMAKLEGDLTKLITKVVFESKYTGKVDEFIFVYNTHNNEKHNDMDNRIPHLFDENFCKYKVSFKYQIWNVEDVVMFIRHNIDLNTIQLIIENLNLEDDTRRPEFMSEVRELLNKLIDYKCPIEKTIFRRISTTEKIDKVDLSDIREEIETSLKNPSYFNQLEELITDEHYNRKFMLMKDKIISIYRSCNDLNGVEKFEYLVSATAENLLWPRSITRAMVIYVFDKCDIFSEEQ